VDVVALTTTIAKANIATYAWNLVFNTLNSNLANPHTTGKWIYSAYPEDKVTESSYPLIVLPPVTIAQTHLTIGAAKTINVPITFTVEIYSVKMDTLDSITDDVIDEIDKSYVATRAGNLHILGQEPSSTDTLWLDEGIRIHFKGLTFRAEYSFECAGT
jgi:hypothetical protein